MHAWVHTHPCVLCSPCPSAARWRGGGQPPPKGHTANLGHMEVVSSPVWKTHRQRCSLPALAAVQHRGPAASLAVEAEPAAAARRGSKLPSHHSPCLSRACTGSWQEGGRRGREVGICCLREQGESTAVEEALSHHPTPLLQMVHPPPNHSRLICASRSVRCECLEKRAGWEEPGRAGPRGRRRICEVADLAGPRG